MSIYSLSRSHVIDLRTHTRFLSLYGLYSVRQVLDLDLPIITQYHNAFERSVEFPDVGWPLISYFSAFIASGESVGTGRL